MTPEEEKEALQAINNFDQLLAKARAAKTKIEEQIAYISVERSKLETAICNYMVDNGAVSIDYKDTKFSVRKTPPSVLIIDKDVIPQSFLRTKTTTSPNKIAIKNMIQAGGEVPGTRLSNGGVSLVIKAV